MANNNANDKPDLPTILKDLEIAVYNFTVSVPLATNALLEKSKQTN